MTKNKITEGNAFALCVRQAKWRTIGGVIQTLQASELVDVHLYVGQGGSKASATEYPVTADGDTISAVMPATLKRGVYRTWLTAIYNGREVASNCDAAFEIVAFDEHYQAYAPERVDAPMAVYLQPADVTDAELEQLKAEFRAKNAALDAAKAEAEQARQEYIAKAEALESVATSEQVVAIGALTSEEIGRVKELIGTPADGQAKTLFAAINASPVGIIADVEQGKKDISKAIAQRGGISNPSDAFSTMAESIRAIPAEEIPLAGTEWVEGYEPKTAAEVITNQQEFLLKLVSAKKTISINYYLSNLGRVQEVTFTELENVSGISFMSNSTLEKASFPKLKTITGQAFLANCSKLKKLYVPELDSINAVSVFSNCDIEIADFPNLRVISGSDFMKNCKNVKAANFPNLQTCYVNGSSLTLNADYIEFPKLKSATAYFFDYLYVKRFIAKNLTDIRCEICSYNELLEYIEIGSVLVTTTDMLGKKSKNLLKKVIVGKDTTAALTLQKWGDNSSFSSYITDEDFDANFRDGIANNLYDFAANGLGATSSIRLGAYAFAKLSQETIDICTAKGWNVING